MTACSPLRLCLLVTLGVLLAGTARGVEQVAVITATPTITEGSTAVLSFDFIRMNTAGNLTVNFTLSGTATRGSDYVVTSPAMGALPSGTITIPNLSNTASLTLTITDDAVAEPAETIIVTIDSDGAGGTIYTTANIGGLGFSSPTSSIVIFDNEPVLEIITGTIAGEPSTNGFFTVSYPGPARTSAVPFTYVVTGTAIAGFDYVALSTTSIPSGVNTVNIPVIIIDDALADDGKTLIVSLTSSSSYLIKAGQGIASMTLGNDDTGVTAVSSISANGTYLLGSTVIITVTFNNPVAVTGAPTLALATGPTPALAQYFDGNGTNTLSFRYTVGSMDSSAHLDYTGTTALSLNGGTIVKASTTTAAVLTLPVPGQSGSLGANRNVVVNGVTNGQKPVPGSVQSTDNSTSRCGLGQGIAALLLLFGGLLLSLRRR